MGYIDIHNHTLFGVDDGPDEIGESLAMLKKACEQGIEEIILTPHYRYGMFEYNKDDVENNYAELKKQAKAKGLNIKLHLGCEYHVDGEMLDNLRGGRCYTLADSEYVLAEYSYSTDYTVMKHSVHELLAAGYQPVVAHTERCKCIQDNPKLAMELSSMGALIQINADSLLGIDGKQLQKICKKLLKARIPDVVASDAHGIKERKNHMQDAYSFVGKKYGVEYAEDIFYNNLKNITDIGR